MAWYKLSGQTELPTNRFVSSTLRPWVCAADEAFLCHTWAGSSHGWCKLRLSVYCEPCKRFDPADGVMWSSAVIWFQCEWERCQSGCCRVQLCCGGLDYNSSAHTQETHRKPPLSLPAPSFIHSSSIFFPFLQIIPFIEQFPSVVFSFPSFLPSLFFFKLIPFLQVFSFPPASFHLFFLFPSFLLSVPSSILSFFKNNPFL